MGGAHDNVKLYTDCFWRGTGSVLGFSEIGTLEPAASALRVSFCSFVK